MGNATHRLRKARRQGLAGRGLDPSPRASFRSETRNHDMMPTPRANRARKSRVTRRKAARRAPARRGR